jgi:PAS domain S-box-containing protein
MPKISLRTVLIGVFTLQVLVTVGAIKYLSNRNQKQSIKELTHQVMEEVGDRIGDRLESYLQVPQDIVRFNDLATRNGILDLNDIDSLQKYLWNQIDSRPDLTSIYFANNKGELIEYIRVSSQKEVEVGKRLTGKEPTIGTLYLGEVRRENLSQRNYYSLDESGRPQEVVYSTDINFSKLGWYRQAIGSKKQAWTPVVIYQVSGILGIFAVAPIYSKTNEFQAVFASHISLSSLSDFLRELNFSTSGEAFILNRSGHLVATSTSESLAVKSPDRPFELLPADRSNNPRIREIYRQISQNLDRLETLKEPQNLTVFIENRLLFVRVIPYRDPLGLDWLIVVNIPEHDVMGKIHENTRTTVFLSILILMISTGIGILTARWITQPIIRLNEIAKQFSLGDFHPSIPENPIHEIGELADSFQRMSRSLDRSFEALKKSEEKFSTLLDAVPVGISVLDRKGKVVVMNGFAKKILGLANLTQYKIRWIPKFYQIYVAGTDRLYPWKQLPFLRALKGETVLADDLEIHRRDGKVIPLEIRATPVFDDRGKVIYTINAFVDISDRLEAERVLLNYNHMLEVQVRERTEALQSTEARLNAFFASATVGMCILDDELNAIKINEPFAAIDAVDIPNSIGKSLEEISPKLAAKLQSLCRRVLRSDRGILNREFAIEYPLLNHYKRDFMASLFPILSKKSTHCGVGIVLLEISDRKRVEEALSQSESTLRSFFNSASMMMGIVEVQDNDILHISDNLSYARFFGTTPEAVKNRWASEIEVPESVRQLWIERYREAERTQSPVRFEYVHQTPDGDRYLSATVCTIAVNVNGRSRFSYIVEDISDRQRAEQALRTNEARLRNLATAIPGIIYSLLKYRDSSLKFEYINRAVEEIYEMKVEDFLENTEETLLRSIYPEDLEAYQKAVNRSAETLERFRHEWRIITPSGKIKWLQANSQPEARQNGEICWHGIVQDISDRKQAEVELARAKEAAEAANQAKSTFLASMSHELRTPLNVILGFAQLMSYSSHLTPSDRKSIEIINRSGSHLLMLINDVLDMAKIEAGRIILNENSFNFNVFIEDLRELFDLKAIEKKLLLQVDIDPNIPTCLEADEVRLRQILINLLGNAIKFTDYGFILLKASLQDNDKSPSTSEEAPRQLSGTVAGDRVRVEFEVRDSGIGIPEEQLESIFEPFLQTRTGKQSQEGTGLGLAIVRKFVTLMGGTISVRSQLGEGSQFLLRVPLKVASIPGDGGERSLTEKPIALEGNPSRYRILVVDDCADNRELLLQILLPFGFQIREASDGFEALEEWERWRPDVVFMDMQIPGMDGMEVTREIRKREDRLTPEDNRQAPGGDLVGESELFSQSKTIVISVSASSFQQQKNLILNSGCDEAIDKPFQTFQILESLSKHLGLRYISKLPATSNLRLSSPDKEVDSTQFATVSVEQILALEAASLRGKISEIYSILDRIALENTTLSEQLRSLADRFQYQKILTAIQNFRENSNLH